MTRMGKRKRLSKGLTSSNIIKQCRNINDQCVTPIASISGSDPIDHTTRLADDELALIFQKISFLDLLNAELVCKRWRRVVVIHPKCWSNFGEISFNALYGVTQDKVLKDSKLTKSFVANHLYGACNTRIRFYISMEKLTYLFQRCHKFIKEFSFDRLSHSALFNPESTFFEQIMPSLKTFKQLAHLNLDGIRPTNDQFEFISNNFSHLKSLAVSGVGLDASNGLNLLLQQSNHLEYFRIQECHIRFHSHIFVCLPASLQYLEADRSVDMASLVAVAATKCNHLTTLVLRDWHNEFAYDQRLLLKSIAEIKTLRHFLMHLQNCSFPLLETVLTSLPLLKSLELQQVDIRTLRLVHKHCHHLEHLYFTLTECDTTQLEKDLSSYLAERPSLFIRCEHMDCSTFPLILARLLEERACSTTLNKDNHLFWADNFNYDKICNAVDKIHRGKKPNNSDQKRVLCRQSSHGFLTETKNYHSHACVQICQSCKCKRAREMSRFTSLSSIPNFLWSEG